MGADIVEIENCKLIRSTEKAALYQIKGNEVWIPWSQIDEGSVDRDGDTGTLYVSGWIAKEKGLV